MAAKNSDKDLAAPWIDKTKLTWKSLFPDPGPAANFAKLVANSIPHLNYAAQGKLAPKARSKKSHTTDIDRSYPFVVDLWTSVAEDLQATLKGEEKIPWRGHTVDRPGVGDRINMVQAPGYELWKERLKAMNLSEWSKWNVPIRKESQLDAWLDNAVFKPANLLSYFTRSITPPSKLEKPEALKEANYEAIGPVAAIHKPPAIHHDAVPTFKNQFSFNPDHVGIMWEGNPTPMPVAAGETKVPWSLNNKAIEAFQTKLAASQTKARTGLVFYDFFAPDQPEEIRGLGKAICQMYDQMLMLDTTVCWLTNGFYTIIGKLDGIFLPEKTSTKLDFGATTLKLAFLRNKPDDPLATQATDEVPAFMLHLLLHEFAVRERLKRPAEGSPVVDKKIRQAVLDLVIPWIAKGDKSAGSTALPIHLAAKDKERFHTECPNVDGPLLQAYWERREALEQVWSAGMDKRWDTWNARVQKTIKKRDATPNNVLLFSSTVRSKQMLRPSLSQQKSSTGGQSGPSKPGPATTKSSGQTTIPQAWFIPKSNSNTAPNTTTPTNAAPIPTGATKPPPKPIVVDPADDDDLIVSQGGDSPEFFSSARLDNDWHDPEDVTDDEEMPDTQDSMND